MGQLYYIYKRLYRDDSLPSGKGYQLYAFTDSKKIAKRFETQRDMSLFKKQTVTLESDQIKYLLEEHGQSSLVSMKINIEDLKQDLSFNQKFVVTKHEYAGFQSKIATVGIYTYTHAWYPPRIFNKHIQKSLDILGYTYMNDYISGEESRELIYNRMLREVNEDDKKVFKEDQYGILFDIIGDTLK